MDFKKFENHNATEKSFSKINIQNKFEIISNRKVVLSDLDIVNHVNNVKYLEWCLDFIDFDVIINSRINTLEMNFLKELSLCDAVEIGKNENTFIISKENKTCYALEIEL